MLTNKAFTMIEMIFVLSIICILYMFTIYYKSPSIKDENINYIITQKLFKAKMHAINYKEKTKISFNESSLCIESNFYNETYSLPEGFTFDTYSFTYNQYGRIKTAKTVTFHGIKKDYIYKFQLGTGYFYVQT